MAVAHSTASESHTGTTGSTNQASFSWSHGNIGTPQGVLVFVHTISVTDTVTSVTYGGVTLTRVTGGAAIDNAGEPGRTDLFFAGSGLGAGNQTITVNRTNNATIMYASAATVTAATDTNVTGIVLLQGDGTMTVQSVTDGGAPTNSLRYAGAYSGLATPPPAGTGSSLRTIIDFGNYGCAMVSETTAGTGARNIGFNNATTDDRAAVHVAVRELWNRTDTQTVGSFTLTGNDATLAKASPKAITAETGAFTLTGNAADLRHNPGIEAGVGAFTLTGNPADARHNVRIESSTDSFSLTGNDATLRRNYTLEAAAGAFATAGQAVTLRNNPRVEAATGTFALNGGDPALLRGYYLSGGAGTFTETGQPATFSRTWAIQAATGAFSFTGNPASLTELGAYEIDPTVGSFALSGQPATLAQSQTMPVNAGTFTLDGQPATLRYNPAISADRGQFTLTGNPATLAKQATTELAAGTGSFALSGQSAALTTQVAKQLTVTAGNFALTGNAVALPLSKTITAERGQFTLIGNPIAPPSSTYNIPADTGTFHLTGAPNTFVHEKRRRIVLIF